MRQQRAIRDFLPVQKKGATKSAGSKPAAKGASAPTPAPTKQEAARIIDNVRANKRQKKVVSEDPPTPVPPTVIDEPKRDVVEIVVPVVEPDVVLKPDPPIEFKTPTKNRSRRNLVEDVIVVEKSASKTPTKSPKRNLVEDVIVVEKPPASSSQKRRVADDDVSEAESLPDLVISSSPASVKIQPPSSPMGPMSPMSPGPTPLRTVSSATPLVPAHVKYRHLVEPGVRLPLPAKYRALEQIFHALEHTVMFVKSRDQSATFHRVKKPVENTANRTFELSHLAQIVTVYPEAYTMTPVRIMDKGIRVESLAIEFARNATGADIKKASLVAESNVWLPRRETFHDRLLDRVKTEHAKMLQKLKFKLKYDPMQVSAWHPRFELESVPDIPEAVLPAFPPREVMTLEALLEARKASTNGKLKEPEKVKPIVPTPQPSQPIMPPPTPQTPTPSTKPQTKASAMLERIREKERLKLEASLFSHIPTPEETKRRVRLSRLEDVIQCLLVLYVSSRKNVLPLSTVSQHVANGHKAQLSESEAREHLKVLAEVLPEFCKLIGDQNNLLRSVNSNLKVIFCTKPLDDKSGMISDQSMVMTANLPEIKRGPGRPPKNKPPKLNMNIVRPILEPTSARSSIPALITLKSQSFSSLGSASSQTSFADLDKIFFHPPPPPLLHGLPREVWARTISYLDTPSTFARVSRQTKSICEDPHSKAGFLRFRYGTRMALVQAFLKHRKVLTHEVAKMLLSTGALLPRYMIQMVVQETRFVVPYSKMKFVSLILKNGLKLYGYQLQAKDDDVDVFYRYLLRNSMPGLISPSTMGMPMGQATSSSPASYMSTDPNTPSSVYSLSLPQDQQPQQLQQLLQPNMMLNPTPLETIRDLVVKYHFAPTMEDPVLLAGRRAYMIWRLLHDDPTLLPILQHNGLDCKPLNDAVVLNAFFRKHPLLPNLTVSESVKICLASSFKFNDELVLKLMMHDRLHDSQLVTLKQYYTRNQLDAFATQAVERLLNPSKLVNLLHRADPRHPVGVRMLLGHLTVSNPILMNLLTMEPGDALTDWVAQSEFRRTRLRWVVKVFGQDHLVAHGCMEDYLKWL
ncbi:hypothetical protein SmJEL517_g02157 [Synchytrium microbalum]|uniref:CDT1 Geminin-binding domain-containing protein n=1 Tax=Synchytrium microbalum TaxID=1806994 RepID=A0A507CBU7_9FUNG|nr:uncharacterized protein SmJEL517_g02157 [Synchytrium microbalum]TPX35476.1 hypothetical protein SmJEL517_g02157 [Synchytrium microbalum]